MNYRHIFHAGNFADVFKHWVLSLLLVKFIEKDNGFCFIDLHAGLGIYNLEHENAKKTAEAAAGIKLLEQQADPIFASYLEVVDAIKQEYGNYYPGSPKIAQYFLRAQDRMLLSELHPEDYQELTSNFKQRNIKLFQQDGYAMLKANLPPREKRGLVLIDPPFEKRDEFAQIVIALQAAQQRFATGIYAIWYPIKDHYSIKQFYNSVSSLGFEKVLCVEMYTAGHLTSHLSSCGMLIINAPWKLDEQLNYGMPKLLQQLNCHQGKYHIKELV